MRKVKNLIITSRALIIVGVLPYILLILIALFLQVDVGGLIPLTVHILFATSTLAGVVCAFFVLLRAKKEIEVAEEYRPNLRALKWLLVTGLVHILLVAYIVVVGLWAQETLKKFSDERSTSPEFCRIAVVDPSQSLPRDAEHRKVFLESVCTIPVRIEKIDDPKHCTIAVEDPSAPLKRVDERYVDWLMNTSGCTKVDIVGR